MWQVSKIEEQVGPGTDQTQDSKLPAGIRSRGKMTSIQSMINGNDSPGFVLDRLEQIAMQYPMKPAVRFDDRMITYAEFIDAVNQLSSLLEEKGVGTDSLVAIGLDRSIEMAVAVFGVWKSGAAFVPLDPHYPAARLALMLKDSNPAIVLGNTANRAKFNIPDKQFIEYDRGCHPAVQASYKAKKTSGKDVAYVIYTSGSTGDPKGVQISHGALNNFLLGIQQSLRINSSDTLVAVTTLSFDISILEIALPLTVGATVVIVDRRASGEGHALAKVLETRGATFLQATPVTWRLLLESGWSGKSDLNIICGGENLPRSMAEALLERGKRVFNVYGPTEATIWATIEQISSGVGAVSIGRALPHYETCVLNESLDSVAVGDAGQLYIGGRSLAEGYLNRSEETAKRFIHLPSGGRMYATGDIVRERPDGKLEFLGRSDTQVKIRGFRVELGEIEAQIVNLGAVKEAVVLLKEDKPGEKKLTAYVTLEDRQAVAAVNWREQLQSSLPQHMIPHYFVELDALPKTPNNKVDRKQLAALEARQNKEKSQEIIVDPLEAYLHDVWVKVLGVEQISAEDNFLELGGDSIQAAMITNHLQDWLGDVVWPVVLFDEPTIRELAGYLRRNYPHAVGKRIPSTALTTAGSGSHIVDRQMLSQFNSLIRPITPYPAPARKNPPAVFILTPPRSGSTLLRVMMTGHPAIFAPPEIELLTFNTMGERLKEFSGRERYRLEGTIRAVMEIKNCEVEEARAIVSEYERADTPVSEFYGTLQSWLGEQIFVDKTPSNCLDIESLRRAESYFDSPLYIHLTRHPLGMIRSFVKARLSEVFFRRVNHDYSPRELGELIWLSSHRNILKVLDSIPEPRKIRIAFENLTRSPVEIMNELCSLVGIQFDAEMVEPQKNKEKKMTDGLHSVSRMMGDPKYHSHNKIDPSVSEIWRQDMDESSLGDLTISVARELGYDLVEGDAIKREEFVL